MNSIPPDAPSGHFLGHRRTDGRCGTRNHLGVFVVGNCAATAARQVAAQFAAERLRAWPNVDAVLAFVHDLGCGMEKSGEPMDLLRRTLGGSIRNPNLGGALVLALGCERNNLGAFLEQEALQRGPLLHTVVLQEVGGTANAVAAGAAAIEAMLPLVNASRRVPLPAAQLVVGLHGGAGGQRTAAARAVLGAAVDELLQAGGTAIACDTRASAPALLERAAQPSVAATLEERLAWWSGHTAGRDTGPALRSHSAGHCGGMPLQGVLGYAHAVQQRGLVLMDSPGHEAVAGTGQVAAGANLVCTIASTGASAGVGGVPCVQLAADSALFEAWRDDLDFDCGPAADGRTGVQALGRQLYEQWLAHASGRRSCSEVFGLGDHEFVPWPVGVMA